MNNQNENDPLEDIKRLLILALARSGATQTEIGTALDIDRTTVGRMFPSGFLASVSKGER